MERLTWKIFEAEAWRLRVGGMGMVLGIESGIAIRRLERSGVEPALAEALFSACEQGLVIAFNEKDNDDDDEGGGGSPVGEG